MRFFWWFLPIWLLTTNLVQSAVDEDEDRYRFRFRSLSQSSKSSGTPPREVPSDHGEHGLSEADMLGRQKKAKEFWREQRSGEITKADVVKLYSIAGDFAVVHALLGSVISPADSRAIGRLRAEIHEEVLQSLAKSKKFGSLMGVNDFGSGADLSTVDAKTDIDFTLYNKLGSAGSEMVAAYKEAFRQITGQYGASIDPGQCDIVAHRYEATLPDWRQGTDVAGFEAKLRTGLDLLRSNPEAYFLEGAYMQQVMKRSVDPDAKTFTWYDVEEGALKKSAESAALQKEYFFHPETHERYAFGGAVGNWHFFHAHGGDQVARAKYILRSIDDGVGMIYKDTKKGDFEKMSRSEQSAFIQKVYGGKFSPELTRAVQATLDTSVHMRQLKKDKALNLLSETGRAEAYRPLVELLRTENPGASLAELTNLAETKFNQVGNAVLIENNIQSSTARLSDWLQPPLKKGSTLDAVDEHGHPRKVHIDGDAITRLQYSAFFELHSAISLMDPGLIERIKKANPRFRRDIEILEGVVRKKQQMMLAPETIHPDEALSWRRQKAAEVQAEIQRLRGILETRGYASASFEGIKSSWDAGQRFESWMQSAMIDTLVRTAGGRKYIPLLHKMRQEVETKNLEGLGPKWMGRIDKGTSVVQVLKTYAREGEVNDRVLEAAMYEVLSFVPGMGTVFAVQGGVESMATLTFVNLIPGYGQMFLVLNFAHGVVELGGLLVFEPLKRDKILLAYQGYLPAVEGGWFFGVGQKDRVESPRPPLLYPVDPAGTLPMEERREKMYQYLHNQVITRMRANPDIWYDETEYPKEWQDEEFKELHKFVTGYVNDWWNATGIFSEFDVLTVHRGEDIRDELITMLIKDYIRGKNIALQRIVQERLAAEEQLMAQYRDIAAGEYVLEKGADQFQNDYGQMGEMVQAFILDDMPTINPSIEVYAAQELEEVEGGEDEKKTLSEQVNLRAKVSASFKEHPGPWHIEWTMNNSQSGDVAFDIGQIEEVEARTGTVTISASAKDAEGREIVRTNYSMSVEKIKIEDVDNDKDNEANSSSDNNLPSVEEILNKLRSKADTAASLKDQAKTNCDETKKRAEKASEEIDKATEQVQQATNELDQLSADVNKLLEVVEKAPKAADKITEMGYKLAKLRDEIEKKALKICELARDIAYSKSPEERQQLLQQLRALRSEIDQQAYESRKLINRTKEILNALQKLKQEALGLGGRLSKANDTLDTIDTNVGQAGASIQGAGAELANASARTADLQQVQNESGALLDEGKDLLQDHIESSREARDLEKEMEGLYGKVQGLKSSVEDCPEHAEEVYNRVTTKQATLQDQSQQAHHKLNELNQTWEENNPIGTVDEALDDAGATWTVMEIFFEGIIDRINDSQACERMGDNAATKLPKVTVPDVRGYSQGHAIQRIEQENLKAVTAAGPPAPNENLKGTVAAQNPAPATSIEVGKPVTIVIYGEPETIVVYTVPKVVGMRKEAAAGALTNAGFAVSGEEGDPAPTKDKVGLVYSQRPAAGADFEEQGIAVSFSYYGKMKQEDKPPATAEEIPPYYVVCKLYMPKPKGKPPKDPKRVDAWYNALTINDVNFVPQEKFLYLGISEEALERYSQKAFTVGRKIAMPIDISAQTPDGNVRLKGALLLQVVKVHNDKSLLQQEYPESREQGAIFPFTSKSGKSKTTINQQGTRATILSGPLKGSWTPEMKQGALNIYKQIVRMFKCFVATAIYDSWQHGKLAVLRQFRDQVMARSESGQKLIQWYYQHGPEWSLWIQDHPRIKRTAQICLDGVVEILSSIDWSQPAAQNVADNIFWVIEWMTARFSEENPH